MVFQTTESPQFHVGKVIDCAGRASSSSAVVTETAEFGLLTASCGMKFARNCW